MKNDMAAFSRILNDVSAWMERHAIPEVSRFTLNLAFEELVRNVMRHAYGDADPSREIRIELREAGPAVVLTVEDDGPPFDPTNLPPPDTTRPVAERREGGLGVHLVRTLVSQMSYERRGSSNVVTVTISRD
jgi:anti-sigma regulatory factor (Ser/Thr protein kinase)